MAARPLWLIVLLPWLTGFVPYAHDGTLAVVVDGQVVRARAVFSTEAADRRSEVLVRSVFTLPGGGEATLAMLVPLVAVGTEVSPEFTYYEKSSPSDVVFKAEDSEGRVLLGDRFEYGAETSLYLEFDVVFRQGEVERRLESGWVVTAPSPSILRSAGRLPDGVIVIDDGSGAYTGRAYDHGSVDCYGYPEEPVLIETQHHDFVVVESKDGPEVVLDDDDDGIDGVDVADDYEIIYDPADNTSYDTDSDGPSCFTDDDSSTSGGDEPAGCGSGSETSSESSESAGCGRGSDSDSGCVGDAEAARQVGAAASASTSQRAALRRPAWARRVLKVSPLLLGFALLLIMPRPR